MKNRVRGLASRTARLVILAVSLSTLPVVSLLGAAWHNNFEEALSTAQSQKKPILVDFSTTWCGYCKQLDATTFQDPSVLNILDRSFVRVKVDGEARADLAARYQVKAYPTIVFLDSNGYSVKSESGFIDSRQMVSNLSGVERQFNSGSGPSPLVASASVTPAQPGLAARLLNRLPGRGDKAPVPPPASAVTVAAQAAPLAMAGRTRYGGGQVYADGNAPAPAVATPTVSRQDTLATAEIVNNDDSLGKIEADLKITAEPDSVKVASSSPKEPVEPVKPAAEEVKPQATTEASTAENRSTSMYNLPSGIEAPKPLIARSVTDKIAGETAIAPAPTLIKKQSTDADQLNEQLATIRKLQGLKFPERREIVSLPSGPRSTATDAGSSTNSPVKMTLGVAEPPALKTPQEEPPPLPSPDAAPKTAPAAPVAASEADKKTEEASAEKSSTEAASAAKSDASTGAKKEDLDRWFADANSKLKAGHRREARAMFSKVVENDPENISNVADMAFVRMAALIVDSDSDNLRKQAHAKITEFEARYPASEKKDYYTLVRAILAVDLGEKVEAKRLLEDYPTRFPNAKDPYKKQAYDLWKSVSGAPAKSTKATASTSKSKSGSTKSGSTSSKSSDSTSGSSSKSKTTTAEKSTSKKVATR